MLDEQFSTFDKVLFETDEYTETYDKVNMCYMKHPVIKSGVVIAKEWHSHISEHTNYTVRLDDGTTVVGQEWRLSWTK